MQLWIVEHFYLHNAMIHYYRYLFVKMKVFNYSELQFFEGTFYKIHTLAVLLEEKSVLCLFSSLLDSVLFTYFQTVLAGWEVFQSKTKQVLMIFLKKKPSYCYFADENATFTTSIQPKKVSRVSLQKELPSRKTLICWRCLEVNIIWCTKTLKNRL